ncbi:MAG: divalent-cation tolerance protein CutA [Elusimicrobiota bacterium]|jgi:periplasmic divalent cation tolerance protein|nr:divalent-cation tolerance protein CutA [Elusimicrobiota bacterium]
MKCINVFVTVPNKKTADKIARHLLNNKIISCVSIIKDIESFYWWKGKVERSKELLLLMKTVKSKFVCLVKEIKKIHPYEVPEIISIDISAGNKDYIEWIKKNVL